MRRFTFHPLVLVVLFAFLAASCRSTVPFTQSLRQQYSLNEAELKSIQFYTSDPIVLRRGEIERKEVATTRTGTLEVKSGHEMEEVIIPAGTPCLVEKVVDGERVAMRFGQGAKEYLVFGSLNQRDGYYTLQALDWQKGIGQVQYSDNMYTTNRGANQTYLLIKLKSVRQFKKSSTYVKGQRL